MKQLIYFYLLLILSLFSCAQKPDIVIEPDHLFYNKGFTNGFTIQLIGVSTVDSAGVPLNYKESPLRADFIHSSSKKINQIYFLKKNGNSYWKYQLSNRFDTLPIKFEKKQWYLISSNEFKTGTLGNIYFRFFIYSDSVGKLHVFKSSEAISPI